MEFVGGLEVEFGDALGLGALVAVVYYIYKTQGQTNLIFQNIRVLIPQAFSNSFRSDAH